MIFEEFDKFQCLENANRIFSAVTNNWGETAVVGKNNVSVFRENRDFNSCLKHFLFDQTIINIEQCPIVSKIGNFLDINIDKIVENLNAIELFEAIVDISATPTISLANQIIEIPLTVYWMDRDYLLILTNVGNVQVFRKSNNEWRFHSNLADIYLAHMQSKGAKVDVDQHQCLKMLLNQLVFTAACSLRCNNKYMLFIGSRNGEISLWECDSEDMAIISFLKTFTPYKNERITFMETYSVNSNEMILVVGYLNGNLIYYHTNVSCRNFDQFSIIHDDRDLIAVNFIKRISANVILAVKNNYLLIVKISFDTNMTCDAEFIKVSSDAISGVMDLKDQIIISSRFGTCKSLDPVSFSLSNFDSSFLITDTPDRRTCYINGIFSTRNHILGIFLNDQTTKRGLQLMPILKNKQLDDPISYLCDLSLRVNSFDNYFDLLELCRYYCRKNPVVVSNFVIRKQSFQKFNVVQLSLLLRILKMYESMLLPDERSNSPISSIELQNGLLAKYAFKLLRDLMDRSSNLTLTQSRRACISYLTYFASLSYQSRFFDDYTVNEIESLLFSAMTSDDLSAEDVSLKCLFCSGDFIFGLYCENLHPTQICVCSLVPFVNFFSNVYCPSCKFLVNEDFYDSFENKDHLVCCFCQVTVCKY